MSAYHPRTFLEQLFAKISGCLVHPLQCNPKQLDSTSAVPLRAALYVLGQIRLHAHSEAQRVRGRWSKNPCFTSHKAPTLITIEFHRLRKTWIVDQYSMRI